MDIIYLLNSFAQNHPWVPLAIGIYLIVAKAIVGIRDSIDKTPASDDNWFERFSTIIGKSIGYMGGFRPGAAEGTKPIAGATSDAAGVKVEEKK